MTGADRERDPVEILTSAIDDAISALTSGSGAGPTTGHSVDRFVSATVAGDGRLSTLEIDPRVLRGDADQLAARVVEAYNEARDATPAPDPAQRRARLQQAKENSSAAMTELSQSLQDNLRRIVTAAGGQY